MTCVICTGEVPARDRWQCANPHPEPLHFDCIVQHFLTQLDDHQLDTNSCPLCRRVVAVDDDASGAAAEAKETLQTARFVEQPNAPRGSRALRICDIPDAGETVADIVARARTYYHLAEAEAPLRRYGRLLLGVTVRALEGDQRSFAALPQILALGDGNRSPTFALYRALPLLRVLAQDNMILFHRLLPAATPDLPLPEMFIRRALRIAHTIARSRLDTPGLIIERRARRAEVRKFHVIRNRLGQLTPV